MLLVRHAPDKVSGGRVSDEIPTIEMSPSEISDLGPVGPRDTFCFGFERW